MDGQKFTQSGPYPLIVSLMTGGTFRSWTASIHKEPRLPPYRRTEWRRREMTQHRLDVPQPDPIVHNSPSDSPHVPEYEPLDDQPLTPSGDKVVAEDAPLTF